MFAEYTDMSLTFCGRTYPSEYYCRAILWGRVKLEKAPDGSYSASASLDVGA